MRKKFYRRKRLWILFLLLSPLAALLIYLALNPLVNFRKTVNYALHLGGIDERYVRIDHSSLHIYEGGTNHPETVILLHGFGGNAQLTWMRLMPVLAKRYHVVAPDLLASSFLGLNPKTYSVDSEVTVVRKMMAAMSIEHADFVGLSVGGWVSLILALDEPQKVDKLIVAESAGLTTEIPEMARLTLTDRPTARRFLRLLFYKPPPLPGFVLDELIKASTHIKAKYEAVFLGFVENSRGRLLDDRVSAVRQPTLIIHGREDQVIPLAVSERLHRLIPNSQLIVLEKSGHAPVWDQPKRFKQAILDFLAAPAPSATSLPNIPAS